MSSLSVTAVLFKVVALVPEVIETVEAAMDGGEVTAEEARDLGIAIAVKLGDIKVKVKGKDVLHLDATKEILGGVARIVRQVILASRG